MIDFGFERLHATLALTLANNCVEDALELVTNNDISQLEALIK